MTISYPWPRSRTGQPSPPWARGRAGALVAAILVALLGQVSPAPFQQPPVARAEGCPTPYLHTAGAQILDACGAPVTLRALNWYGFDSNDFVAGGLHYWSYKTIVNRIKSLGYNALRIPFSNELVERDPVVSALGSICVQQSCVPVPGTAATPLTGAYLLAAANDASADNADLVGLDALSILKAIVDYAGQQGLYVILDDHRSEAAWGPEEDGLWYTNTSCPGAVTPFSCYSPQSWLNDWATLGRLFQGDPNVSGLDLRNEPHWINPNVSGGAGRWQPASCALYVQYAHWGPCTDTQGTWQNDVTDWAQAATQAGNTLLGYNPHWLVFVEGGSTYPQPDGSFTQDSWGENLQGAVSDAINLQVAHQLVYSAHDYPWYQTNDTAANMYADWTRNFGFITVPGQPYTAPLWVGEFGTCTHTNDDACMVAPVASSDYGWWFFTFMSYLQSGDPAHGVPGGISWGYWPVNGTYSDSWDYAKNDWRTYSGERESFGLLDADWSSLSSTLRQCMLIGPSPAQPTATPTLTASATPTATATPFASATSAPSATATLTASPTVMVSASPTMAPSATVTATASITAPPTASATSTPSASPTPTPSATATPTPSVTPSPTLTPSPAPTPPGWPGYTCPPIPTPAPAPTSAPPPPPTPTSIPVNPPPANTPTAPAATKTPVPSAWPTARPAAPTATPGVVPTAVVCPTLPLDWRLPRGRVASGDVLTVRLHTGSRARVAVALRVEVSKTVTTGTGKHRRRVTRTQLAYQEQSHGVADRHGLFTGQVRITYKPARAMPARLSATVQRGCGATSGKTKVTITPPPPLKVSATPSVVASGGRLSVEARTVPRASITARVQVVKTVVTVTGKGKQRRRITHTTTLYQGVIRGVAGARGRFSGVLHVAYKPSHAMPATLTVSAVTAHQGSATYTAHLTIRPVRNARHT